MSVRPDRRRDRHEWLDLLAAASYVRMTPSEIMEGVVRGQLEVTAPHPRYPGEWLIRVDRLEEWARSRFPAPPRLNRW